MNRQQYLLICAMEECAEVSQRISKALRFGLTEVQPGHEANNAERIMEEVVDLVTVIKLLTEAGALPDFEWRESPAKRAKLQKYMEYSERMRVLQ